MSVESIVFFVLVLFFWGAAVAARWLQEQFAKHTTDGREFEPILWSSGPDNEAVPDAESPVPPDEQKHPGPTTLNLSRTVPQKKRIRQLGLHNPQTLRQGIILLAVLGPCRALEPPNDTRSF